jgi:Na+/proline symporter
MGLNIADYCVLGVYFIILITIGYIESRKIKSSGEFFMPRKFGKIMMMTFSFGAGTHADQAVSVASKSFTSGLSGIWYQWLYLPVTPFYWLIAPVMRRFRAITTSDVFELRYNRGVGMLFAVAGASNMVVALGLMLRGSSEVLSASSGQLMPANLIIIVMTALFVIYGLLGGLAAAIYIDFLQGILTIFFSFLLLPLILNAIGGMEGLRQGLAGTNMLSIVAPADINVFYVTVMAITGLVGIVTQPHVMGNCAAGKTEIEGAVGFMGGNFLKRICTIPWSLVGVAGIVYFAGRGVEPDKVFGTVANEFLSKMMPGMLGIFIAGVMASVLSTCDALMLASAALFTENVYKHAVPNRDKKHYIAAARIIAGLVVAGSVVFAYWVADVVKGLEIFLISASMMGLAFWLGLFWRRATVAGAWASTIACVSLWWLSEQGFFINFLNNLSLNQTYRFVVEKPVGLEMYLPWQMLMYLIGGFIAGVAVSLMTKPVSEKKLDTYYALIRTPVKPGEVVDTPCALPQGAVVPPKRSLFPNTSLEILIPSRRAIIGFLVGWLIVGAFVLTILAIAHM